MSTNKSCYFKWDIYHTYDGRSEIKKNNEKGVWGEKKIISLLKETNVQW